MFQKIFNFIKYNNAFTLGVMVLFLGAGMSFAASPALRDSVYASTETVTSIDNTQIVSANLNKFDFHLKINSVKEDSRNYYIDYNYRTLAIENSVWQTVEKNKTLTVSKESLGDKDLGLYVAKELAENINYELSYLKDVQKLQKEKGMTPKVVTVEYSGLVGKLLDPKEQIIEGYDPVIPEEEPEAPLPNATADVAGMPYATPTPEQVGYTTPVVPTPDESNNEDDSTPSATPPVSPSPVDEESIRQVVGDMLSEHQEQPSGGGGTGDTSDSSDDESGNDASDDTDSEDSNPSDSTPSSDPESTPDEVPSVYNTPVYAYPTPTPDVAPNSDPIPI